MKTIKTSILLGLCALLSGAQAEPFRNGERAAIFGDSVTHHGYRVKPLQDFYCTCYPDRGACTLCACML